MPKRLLVDRWALARAFGVSPSTITPWHREGLSAARVRQGGPQRPAVYDARAAVGWFNAHKATGQRAWAPVSLDDLRAAAEATNPKTTTATALMESFDAELYRRAPSRSRNPENSR